MGRPRTHQLDPGAHMTPLRVITNSELTVWRRCQREHDYAYARGYRPVETSEALEFGTRWHRGMEAWWRGEGLQAAIEAAVDGCASEYDVSKLRALLAGYDAGWSPGHDASNVVAVEVEFRAPISAPCTGRKVECALSGGKIDVLLCDGIVEHKTTSEDIAPGSNYWRLLSLNSQVSTYYAGARALGVAPQRCVYDVVKKPTIQPRQIAVVDDDGVKVVLDGSGERVRTKDAKKWRETGDAKLGYVAQTRDETPEEYEQRLLMDIAANPDSYYQRGEVVRLESEEVEAALDMMVYAMDMLDAQGRARSPRNPDACRRYGRMCPYFEVCTGEASLDDPVKFRRLENIHEELGTP